MQPARLNISAVQLLMMQNNLVLSLSPFCLAHIETNENTCKCGLAVFRDNADGKIRKGNTEIHIFISSTVGIKI